MPPRRSLDITFLKHKNLLVRYYRGFERSRSVLQYHMANTVFPHLIYKILEVYLDDIITWGETIQELIENFQKIFEKLENFGIYINPNKIKIGLSEVEYVGYVIDRYGESFSEKKQQQVLDVRQPTTVKDMKSFLGLIGQFRDQTNFPIKLIDSLR